MAHCLQIREPEWMHVTYRAQVRGVVRERVQDMMPLSLMSSSFGQPKIELVLSVFTSQWVEKFKIVELFDKRTCFGHLDTLGPQSRLERFDAWAIWVPLDEANYVNSARLGRSYGLKTVQMWTIAPCSLAGSRSL